MKIGWRLFCIAVICECVFSCQNNENRSVFFYTGFDDFTPLIKKIDNFSEDTSSYILAYYNLDCSQCVGEMIRVNDALLDYSDVCFIISSSDSISASYYVGEMKPNASIFWDEDRAFFIRNNINFNLAEKYYVFVVKNNKLIYARNPFENTIETIRFKFIINSFKR